MPRFNVEHNGKWACFSTIAIAGVCRSVAEARQLLDDGLEEKIDKAKKAAAASKEWRRKKDERD